MIPVSEFGPPRPWKFMYRKYDEEVSFSVVMFDLS
jgi:hypothetical protein